MSRIVPIINFLKVDFKILVANLENSKRGKKKISSSVIQLLLYFSRSLWLFWDFVPAAVSEHQQP